MDSILPVYKPVDMTSYDVIRAFKRAQHPDYKIGHGGTLDPFADGVLLLLLGKATKQMNELMQLPKTYRAAARLGAYSDTLDRTGAIDFRNKIQETRFTQAQLEAVKSQFIGEIEQVIPNYSAAKVQGVPRYKLARQGVAMEQKRKKVAIYELRITNYAQDTVTFETTVSSGTYIRQLSYDIFKSLGVESYLESLTRTAIGPYRLDQCAQIDDFPTLLQ
jgi:tRNA pseudouridine55 synthase